MNFSAVILAGGKSSRMGRDKAFLELDGQTLLSRQVQIVRTAGAKEIFISGRPDVDYSNFDCPVLLDKFSDIGPLAGIERALAEASSPLVLVLAVDMPNLTTEFLQKLISHSDGSLGVIPKGAGQIEPLAAFYPKSSRPLLLKLLDDDFTAVKHFAGQCVESGFVRFADFQFSEHTFANWNSSGDF